jgi:hypothetical protein
MVEHKHYENIESDEPEHVECPTTVPDLAGKLCYRTLYGGYIMDDQCTDEAVKKQAGLGLVRGVSRKQAATNHRVDTDT